MEEFLQSWSYLGIFVGIILTGLGFPMPEELPIVLGGAAAASDKVYWWLMLPVCIVAVVIGDTSLYLLGRYFYESGQLEQAIGLFQKVPRPQFVAVRDEHTARQNAERAFQHTHVLVQHQRTNARAFE